MLTYVDVCRQGLCMRALADYSRALEIEKRTLGEEHVLN
jgi:hypothetical protein